MKLIDDIIVDVRESGSANIDATIRKLNLLREKINF